MYLPDQFRADDPALLAEIIRRHDFATLVTTRDGVPYASHIPVLLDGEGDTLAIRGHVARANPHWRDFDGRDALVIFNGPHCYVSPSWYSGELHVPTWNYVAVHAYGKARTVDDRELRKLLARLTDAHESPREKPWKMGSLPKEFVDELCAGIVGFEIEIARLEGKLKLSQNREPVDRRRVFDQLSASHSPEDRVVAGWMKRIYGYE